uniref:HCLS1-associated protein X-1 n=1 Tax=Pyxicephalus adspersus TaxID=30357 RepID=A0AAV2ZDV9_PYXAD|nr:TPA: hypothetical protein GDO54_004902 [Pyxicephalus adspersus]
MSVFDLFRRFFEPPGMRDPFFGGMTQEYDDDDDDDDDDEDDRFFRGPPRRGFQSPVWGERPPFHDPFGFEEIFRNFNELFADFGAVMHDVPRLPGPEVPRMIPEGSRGGSLRDSMLKFPDSHLPTEQRPPIQDAPREGGTPQARRAPQARRGWTEDNSALVPSGGPKQDKVLDSEISSRGLDSILGAREPASSSFFRSVSVSKVMRPDGTVEERRTVRDSQGNTTTTVTVTRGDEVISSGNLDTPRDSVIGPHPDLSDSQTILSRILHRWFSDR